MVYVMLVPGTVPLVVVNEMGVGELAEADRGSIAPAAVRIVSRDRIDFSRNMLGSPRIRRLRSDCPFTAVSKGGNGYDASPN
jgi:hypothetical protein